MLNNKSITKVLINLKIIFLISNNSNNKNYFLTYLQCDYVYNPYIELLKDFGFTRSHYYFGEHNLFLCPISEDRLNQNKINKGGINKFQKVFRFLNSLIAFNKKALYKYYASMKKIYKEDFNFMSETYIFPDDKYTINKKFMNYSLDINNLWLVKPTNSFGGKKIKILESLTNINLENFLITRYITNVNLINGRKYDLRLYALITGLKPLRIYFYEEGFIRIATQIFSLNITSIKNKFVHLTNICVNNKNKKYVHPNSLNDKNANIWSVSMYKEFLASLNVNWYTIREKIKDIIIKSILCVYEKLYDKNEVKKVNDQSFFNLLGYDILIDDKFSPHLLEINTDPTMEINNILENKIKKKLFTDTLNLIGIVPYSRKTKKPFNVINNIIYDNIDNYVNIALCELKRPRGNYELIFPLKENINIYKKYFKTISEENSIFWDKI